MPKLKENPAQWKPPVLKPDHECSILEIWSRHYKAISEFRNFSNPDKTIHSYTATLKLISPALENRPALLMNGLEIWDAVVSVRLKTKGIHAGEAYSRNSMKGRLSIIADIYKFIETSGIGTNPIRKAPWALFDHIPDFEWDGEMLQKHLQQKFSNKILPRYLSAAQEKQLMEEILVHVNEDGRWVGMALLLWLGLRPSEARGRLWSDRHAFIDHPTRNFWTAISSADEDGVPKYLMKTKNAVRAIPETIELQEVIKRRLEYLKRHHEGDFSTLPVVCMKNNFATPCSSRDFAKFVKVVLENLFKKGFWAESALAVYLEYDFNAKKSTTGDIYTMEDLIADSEITARLLRRNFATKNGATSQSESDLHFSMGHEDDTEDFPYAELLLYPRCVKMDERIILPELHSNIPQKVVKSIISFAKLFRNNRDNIL